VKLESLFGYQGGASVQAASSTSSYAAKDTSVSPARDFRLRCITSCCRCAAGGKRPANYLFRFVREYHKANGTKMGADTPTGAQIRVGAGVGTAAVGDSVGVDVGTTIVLTGDGVGLDMGVATTSVGSGVEVGLAVGTAVGTGVTVGKEVGVGAGWANKAMRKRSAYPGNPEAVRYSVICTYTREVFTLYVVGRFHH